MHMHLHAYIDTPKSMYIYTCKYIHTQMYTDLLAHTYKNADRHTQTHYTHTHACTCRAAHTYICAFIHISTHIHRCTHIYHFNCK